MLSPFNIKRLASGQGGKDRQMEGVCYAARHEEVSRVRCNKCVNIGYRVHCVAGARRIISREPRGDVALIGPTHPVAPNDLSGFCLA